uniref:NB-ARC domain-containing protein n=1 Tax=Leersia perrieri TaxID=77586 RepID=A0A0D9VA16_9ORYZ
MSGVGEMIASSVAKRVASRLGDLVVEESSLLWRFKDDVDNMKEKMRDLEAVMQDADDKARQGGKEGAGERRWLTKLKSVAYDIEDVLDELDGAQLIKNHQTKLKLFLSRNNPLLRKLTIAHNMKNLREKIVTLEKDFKKLNLVRHEPLAEGSRGNETFVVEDDMDIGMLGRDVETEKLVSLLLNTEAKEDISIIPIVGLGGLGKTTLAQVVFVYKRVNVFDMRIWVYVSKEFDLLKIGKAVIRGANKSINLDNCNLQIVQDNLKKELANRRYLIVLDDLWEEYGENLEKLKQMLQHGGKGSKIIVTTRSGSVVQVLHTGYLANEQKVCPVPEPDHINLGVLSPDDCWRVMKRRVFGPYDEQSGLEEIGRQIAKRCGGLPLVANALGQVMSEHKTIVAWTNIRDRKIALDLKADHQRDTLERLMLSYYYMKREFKMCFTYLAAFSKGFAMDTDRLIQQLKALGYIEASDNGERVCKTKSKRLPHTFSIKWKVVNPTRFDVKLVSPVHSKAPRNLRMHDLATIIATDEFLIMDATVPSTWNKANNKRYCRHTQLINYHKQSKVFKDLPSKARTIHFRECTGMQLPPKAFSQAKYIRILDLSGCSLEGQSANRIMLPSSIRRLMMLAYLDVSGLPLVALPKFFHMLQNMQTLILSNCSLETLPANIGNLYKLCCLDLSGNSDLTKLPTSFENLLNLSLLNLSGCAKLEELPESIHNLKCLQQIDMSGCCALQKLPDNFGSLPKLSFLNLSNCSKLTKLPNCLNLESLEHINLSNCHELEELPEDFGNICRLEVLDMSDCYKIDVLPETFCHLKHLKDLNLSDCHGLKQLPGNFGDLSEIQSLNLTSCSKLQLLPQSLCKIHNLKHLNLSYCIRFQDLLSSFGDLQLRALNLSGCYNLFDLPDSISEMTSLTMFSYASGVADVFDKVQTIKEHLSLLDVVKHDVHEMESGDFSSIVELGRLRCRELKVRHLENVEQVEDARRANLRDMIELWYLRLSWQLGVTRNVDKDKLVLENLIPPRTLEKFRLDGYMCKDFPNWVSSISSYLPYLIRLELYNLAACDSLPAFGQLPNLRFFGMEDMPSISRIERGFGCLATSTLPSSVVIKNCNFSSDRWGGLQHLATLEYFKVEGCSGLRTLPDTIQCFVLMRVLILKSCEDLEILPEWLGQLVYLENINIINCPKLTSLPKSIPEGQLPISLKELVLEDCPKLTSLPTSMKNLAALGELRLEGCKGLETLPEGLPISLEMLVIEDCPKLTLLPESMKSLTTLTKLQLRGCEGLEIVPDSVGNLASLKYICIQGCPKLTYLPESMKNLTALEQLWLGGFNNIQEWIGQFIYLKEINIFDSPNMTSLPESIRNLTTLKELYIWCCPRLIERCQGEDANKISHIPRVIFDGERFIPGQAIEGSEV